VKTTQGKHSAVPHEEDIDPLEEELD